MATKARLFNGALLELGHRTLTDTGESVEAGRVLNAVYDQVLTECLAVGSWNWAIEEMKSTSDTGVTPNFGYSEVFSKPSDWVRTVTVSLDERFKIPLTQYVDNVNYWSADTTPIYVRYVSNDTGMGKDLSKWPPTFTRYVELELAARVCNKLTQSESLREQIKKDRDKAKRAALGQDAMNEANPKFPPQGAWSSSRGGGTRERGSRSNLTG